MMLTSVVCVQGQVECISLGQVCSTTSAFETFNLRHVAYPFDWTISPFEALYATLEDDFKHYVNPHYFRIREDNRGIINRHGIVFVHDFPVIDQVGGAVLSSEWFMMNPEIQTTS